MIDFRERICVNSEMISQKEVCDFVADNMELFKSLNLSFFEMTTALAFSHFAKSRVEVAIIETGLGGRLDSTNIVNPILSIITNISLDHTQLLGDSIESIAREKGGIIKREVPIIIGETSPQSAPIFEAIASSKSAPIYFADQHISILNHSVTAQSQTFKIYRHKNQKELSLSTDLMGSYQSKNIVTVATARDIINSDTALSISRRAFLEGVGSAGKATSLKGRWQTLNDSPLTICDTAHNPAGLALVAEQIAATPRRNLICVVGFTKERDITEVLPLFPRDAHFIFTKAASERAKPLDDIEPLAQELGLDYELCPSVRQAYAHAEEIAQDIDMIFIGGSSFVVAEVVD